MGKKKKNIKKQVLRTILAIRFLQWFLSFIKILSKVKTVLCIKCLTNATNNSL